MTVPHGKPRRDTTELRAALTAFFDDAFFFVPLAMAPAST
jgi:hypothetical protein